MSKKDFINFKNAYRSNPIVEDALEKFKKENSMAINERNRRFMYQFIATVGLEIESRFPTVKFADNKIKLFGREKSKRSISTKEQLNTEDFLRHFEYAIENREEDVPAQIRPIYDFYGFKLVVNNVENIESIKQQVVKDFLDDIKEKKPNQYKEIIDATYDEFAKKHNHIGVIKTAVELIEQYFPEEYPDLKCRFENIDIRNQEVEQVNQFIENTRDIDLSKMTYRNYFQKLNECYSVLTSLAYEQSFEEHEEISTRLKKVNDQLAELESVNEADNIIPADKVKKYSKNLKILLSEIENKKTNKLNLEIGDLMSFDVLTTSKQLKRLGVTFSKDDSRTKRKRRPNGYISNFYSLDMPNGLTSELQIQSGYRYEYGEHGPAAHHRMDNNIKKRIFIKRPKSRKKYPNWRKKQFKCVPRYFSYKSNGFIHLYNDIENFRRYYDCEKPKKVKEYTKYIGSNDIKQKNARFIRFKLDSPSALEEKSVHNRNLDNDNKDR